MGEKKSTVLTTQQVLDLIFRDPAAAYKLTEFETLGKPVHEIISIFPKTAATGRDAGKTKYYLKSFVPFASGTEEIQVYAEDGKSAPEEIVRQLWVYKLLKHYDYKADEIALEVGVQFGVGIAEKAADIVVYVNNTKETPKVIVECKKPKRKDGIEQLKSYMNAKGAPVSKVALLQDKTFEMYRLLSSKSGLIQDLLIDNKTYEITIRDRNGHEMRKSALSAGEKEVFAVSLLWGLAQTSQLKLPIIIDTPLSRLDSTHRDNIINNYFPNAADQVVILSTDMEIDKNYFKQLEPHLSGAAHLLFDQRQELTTLQEGYFWEK